MLVRQCSRGWGRGSWCPAQFMIGDDADTYYRRIRFQTDNQEWMNIVVMDWWHSNLFNFKAPMTRDKGRQDFRSQTEVTTSKLRQGPGNSHEAEAKPRRCNNNSRQGRESILLPWTCFESRLLSRDAHHSSSSILKVFLTWYRPKMCVMIVRVILSLL